MTIRMSLLRGLFLLTCSACLHAGPVVYNITFTGAGPSDVVPTAGSFTYDAGSPAFTNFTVIWHGMSFDLSGAANNPYYNIYDALPACLVADGTGAAGSFALLSGQSSCYQASDVSIMWYAGNNLLAFEAVDLAHYSHQAMIIGASSLGGPFDFASGQWTVNAASSAPEPSTTVLMSLAGAAFGWCGIRRRRPRREDAAVANS